jgi:hypothetical protein
MTDRPAAILAAAAPPADQVDQLSGDLRRARCRPCKAAARGNLRHRQFRRQSHALGSRRGVFFASLPFAAGRIHLRAGRRADAVYRRRRNAVEPGHGGWLCCERYRASSGKPQRSRLRVSGNRRPQRGRRSELPGRRHPGGAGRQRHVAIRPQGRQTLLAVLANITQAPEASPPSERDPRGDPRRRGGRVCAPP